jgi:hypothetical protein
MSWRTGIIDTKKLGVRVKFLSNSQESMTKTLIGKEVSGEVDPQKCHESNHFHSISPPTLDTTVWRDVP